MKFSLVVKRVLELHVWIQFITIVKEFLRSDLGHLENEHFLHVKGEWILQLRLCNGAHGLKAVLFR